MNQDVLELLIGTTNKGKFHEIGEVLLSLPVKLVTPQEKDITGSPEETGSTYEENARIKSIFYFEAAGGMATLAEDSGIEIDAFPQELGLKTRRWGAGENATDEEWLAHFLEELKKKPEEKRTARFHCTAALTLKNPDTGKTETHIFNGECPGFLHTEPKTAIPHGIPLSACFQPDGFDKVYAALTPEEKNSISHRGRAIHQVRDFLKQRLNLEDTSS